MRVTFLKTAGWPVLPGMTVVLSALAVVIRDDAPDARYLMMAGD